MGSLNENLIGETGGRARLQTPALVLDLDAFERNLARMAEHAKRHGVALRPHAKTHKSVEIARRQIAAGALGISAPPSWARPRRWPKAASNPSTSHRRSSPKPASPASWRSMRG